MRFGVNTWIWTAPLTVKALRELAPKIKGFGADHIEIPVDDPETLDFKECARILEGEGFESVSCCAAMSPERDLIDADPKVRKTGMEYVKATADGLAVLGGKNLVGPFYSAVGRTWSQSAAERASDLDILVPELRELSEHAAARKVMLGVEPINRFETSFVNTAEQVVELVDRVNHPACGVMLDTFHMNIEENSLGDAIRLVGKRLIQVHANENNRGTPGAGHVPWDEVAKALREVAFDGVLVIESFTSEVKSIARAAAIWRPLAPSQDALARDGVKFLRKLLG